MAMSQGPNKWSANQWATAVGEGIGICAGVARHRSLIHYTEFADMVSTIPLKVWPMGEINALLTDMGMESYQHHGIWITSVVVSKELGHPSPGYFTWMKENPIVSIGDGSVNPRLWLDQVWKVWSHFA
jgi:hypothetical protein